MMYQKFFSVNIGNAIENFNVNGSMMMQVVPEKHKINFFCLTFTILFYIILSYFFSYS